MNSEEQDDEMTASEITAMHLHAAIMEQTNITLKMACAMASLGHAGLHPLLTAGLSWLPTALLVAHPEDLKESIEDALEDLKSPGVPRHDREADEAFFAWLRLAVANAQRQMDEMESFAG